MSKDAKTTDELVEFLTTPDADDTADDEVLAAVMADSDQDETSLEGEDDLEDEDFSSQPDEDETPPEGDEDEEDDEDAEASEGDDPAPYLDVTDEDLIEVKIDGEVTYKTIAEAKKALSGEGAIDKRLQEATEARQVAQAAMIQYQNGLKQLDVKRSELVKTVQKLDEHLFQPLVGEPDISLLSSNPQEYARQVQAHKQDQERIKAARAKLADNLRQQNEQIARNQQQLRDYNEQMLTDKIPELRDPANVKPIMDEMIAIGNMFGFTNEEIAEMFDHRAFMLAHEFAKMKKIVDAAKGDKPVAPKPKSAPQPVRRLRSGVAAKHTQARAKAQAAKRAKAKAAKTGKVDDVVNLILK